MAAKIFCFSGGTESTAPALARALFTMDDACARAAEGLVPSSYLKMAHDQSKRRSKQLLSILSSRRLPTSGFDEISIRSLLLQLSQMDSNNFVDTVGVGEREARVLCPLVKERHFFLGHGMGRSGDIIAPQPKAVSRLLTCCPHPSPPNSTFRLVLV